MYKTILNDNGNTRGPSQEQAPGFQVAVVVELLLLLPTRPPSLPPILPLSVLVPKETQVARPEISNEALEVSGKKDLIHVLMGVVAGHARGQVHLGIVHDF